MDWLSLAPAQNVPTQFSLKSQKIRIKPQARLSTNDAQTLYRLARTGMGLAIVPGFLAEADIATGDMIAVLPDWELPSIEVFAVWPINAPKHGLIHLALAALSQTP